MEKIYPYIAHTRSVKHSCTNMIIIGRRSFEYHNIDMPQGSTDSILRHAHIVTYCMHMNFRGTLFS